MDPPPDTPDVSDRPVHPAIATAAGAVVAGVVGGAGSMLAGPVYGLVLGVAIAMPVFYLFGYGFEDFERDRYYRSRTHRAVALDGVAIGLGALVAGVLAAGGARVAGLAPFAGVALSMAVAFFAGGAVFLARTAGFQDLD